jgi:hypothetical protein
LGKFFSFFLWKINVSFGAEDLTWHISRGIFQAVKNKRGIENGRWRSTFFLLFPILSCPVIAEIKKVRPDRGSFQN